MESDWPIQMIATDLDGTFVNDQKTIPHLNRLAIQEAARRSIPFIFATGRPLRWIKELDLPSEGHAHAVVANGGAIADLHRGRIVHHYPIEPEAIVEFTSRLSSHLPSVTYAVEYLETWGADKNFPYHLDISTPDYTDSINELVSYGPIIKLVVRDNEHDTEQLAQVVFELADERINPTFSFISPIGMIEISAAGVSKASALRLLLDEYQVSPEGLVAFGDMPNDLEMLHLAGRGYTLTKAHEIVHKAGFPCIGDNNDGAVGRTLLDLWKIDSSEDKH